jgi:hypothetical protein
MMINRHYSKKNPVTFRLNTVTHSVRMGQLQAVSFKLQEGRGLAWDAFGVHEFSFMTSPRLRHNAAPLAARGLQLSAVFCNTSLLILPVYLVS